MQMRRTVCLAAAAIGMIGVGCDFDTPSRAGKGYNPNPPKPPVSDETVRQEEQMERANAAWEAVVAQAQPIAPPPSWTNDPPSDEVFAEWERNNGARAAKAGGMTREFGKDFPDHPMATRASDLELKFLRIAVEHGVTAHEDRIRELETRLVGDDPEKLFRYRLDGAMRAALEKRSPDSNVRMVKELERQARRLIQEYPGRAEVYELLHTAAEGLVSDSIPREDDLSHALQLLDEVLAVEITPETRTEAAALRQDASRKLEELKQLAEKRAEALAGAPTQTPETAVVPQPAAATFEELKAAPVGRRMELQFTAADGREIDLAKQQGKVVLIDFWASWCGPCIEELPQLRKAYAKHKDAGFEILGLSLDAKKLDFQRTVGEEKIVWPVAYDQEGWITKLAENLGIDGIPAMWLVDRSGLISSVTAHEDPTAAIEAAMKAK